MSEYTTQDYEQIPYQVAELNKQIILLTAENEELKKQVKFKNQFRDYAHKYKQILTEIKEHFDEECKLCKAKYVNITDEICEECETKYMLQKISECEVD